MFNGPLLDCYSGSWPQPCAYLRRQKKMRPRHDATRAYIFSQRTHEVYSYTSVALYFEVSLLYTCSPTNFPLARLSSPRLPFGLSPRLNLRRSFTSTTPSNLQHVRFAPLKSFHFVSLLLLETCSTHSTVFHAHLYTC